MRRPDVSNSRKVCDGAGQLEHAVIRRAERCSWRMAACISDSHMGRDGNKTAILTYCLRATFAGWEELEIISFS
jgi:hypothetical protein